MNEIDNNKTDNDKEIINNKNNETDNNNMGKTKNYYWESKKRFSIIAIIIAAIVALIMGIGLGSVITYFSMPNDKPLIEEPISPFDPINDDKEIYSTQLEFFDNSSLLSRVNLEYYTYTDCVWVDTYGKPSATGYVAPETAFYNEYHQRIFVLSEDTEITGSYYAPQDVFEAINKISYINYETAATIKGTFANDIEFNFEYGVEPSWSFTDGTARSSMEQTNSYISLD